MLQALCVVHKNQRGIELPGKGLLLSVEEALVPLCSNMSERP